MHYTGETELRQGDEVKILWNADVLCRWGCFCPIGCVSIRQHLGTTISPFLQPNRETTNADFISEWDNQRNQPKCHIKIFWLAFLMKLLRLWTRLKAGPIDWLEFFSLETKGGAWTCRTSASSRGSSFNLLCWWTFDQVWEYFGLKVWQPPFGLNWTLQLTILSVWAENNRCFGRDYGNILMMHLTHWLYIKTDDVWAQKWRQKILITSQTVGCSTEIQDILTFGNICLFAFLIWSVYINMYTW